MKYMSEDGKVYDSESEALARDKEVAAEQAAQDKLIKEKQTRKDSIKEDCRALVEKIEQYNEDYKEPLVYREGATVAPDIVRDLTHLFNLWGWYW